MRIHESLANDKEPQKSIFLIKETEQMFRPPGEDCPESLPFADSRSFWYGRLSDKELYRNKLSKAGEGFFVGSKAEKHSHTWCMASFDNAAADEKDKPECSIYFYTVPKHG